MSATDDTPTEMVDAPTRVPLNDPTIVAAWARVKAWSESQEPHDVVEEPEPEPAGEHGVAKLLAAALAVIIGAVVGAVGEMHEHHGAVSSVTRTVARPHRPASGRPAARPRPPVLLPPVPDAAQEMAPDDVYLAALRDVGFEVTEVPPVLALGRQQCQFFVDHPHSSTADAVAALRVEYWKLTPVEASAIVRGAERAYCREYEDGS
jgi:Protein of unknown function (DUF732)